MILAAAAAANATAAIPTAILGGSSGVRDDSSARHDPDGPYLAEATTGVSFSLLLHGIKADGGHALLGKVVLQALEQRTAVTPPAVRRVEAEESHPADVVRVDERHDAAGGLGGIRARHG